MYVYFDTEAPGPPRMHPWDKATKNSEWRYYDLKSNLELTPTVLEDFKPWERYPAIQNFYDLLRWINGPDAIFETNDCGLRADPQSC